MLVVKRDELAKKRKERNLSQHRLSVLSGLSGNAIYRMECRDHKISTLRARAVADTLNCTIDELFYSDNNKREMIS